MRTCCRKQPLWQRTRALKGGGQGAPTPAAASGPQPPTNDQVADYLLQLPKEALEKYKHVIDVGPEGDYKLSDAFTTEEVVRMKQRVCRRRSTAL